MTKITNASCSHQYSLRDGDWQLSLNHTCTWYIILIQLGDFYTVLLRLDQHDHSSNSGQIKKWMGGFRFEFKFYVKDIHVKMV